jgi:hypothetical protein
MTPRVQRLHLYSWREQRPTCKSVDRYRELIPAAMQVLLVNWIWMHRIPKEDGANAVVFMACHLGVYELQIADDINRPSIDGAWAE